MIETDLLQRFTQLIAAHTGLQIRADETDKLRHTIHARMVDQHLVTPEAYYQLLANDSAASRHEWEELICPLTIGESYFFRDSGQFSLLRQRVMPELIERNRAARSLRIWSAGCSSGEEPYSLAILVQEMLPSRGKWQVIIVGTDVNKRAIAAARDGCYREHSLRTLDQGQRTRYFRQHREHWELDERIRSMVFFRQLNLLRDPFPDVMARLAALDLILCRNVFIYFERSAITQVLTKFTNTLSIGGYLMTGHAELHDQNTHELYVKSFPESIVYQRQDASPQLPHMSLAKSPGAVVPAIASPSPPLWGRGVLKSGAAAAGPILRPSHQGASSPVKLPALDDVRQDHVSRAEELYGQARRCADAGNYEEAQRFCRLALVEDHLAEKPYYLLAQIAEVQGDIAAAKQFLNKILYLSPTAIMAHLELAALYTREHDLLRARRMLNIAAEQLRMLAAHTVIGPFNDVCVADLLPEVQRRLDQFGPPPSGGS